MSRQAIGVEIATPDGDRIARRLQAERRGEPERRVRPDTRERFRPGPAGLCATIRSATPSLSTSPAIRPLGLGQRHHILDAIEAAIAAADQHGDVRRLAAAIHAHDVGDIVAVHIRRGNRQRLLIRNEGARRGEVAVAVAQQDAGIAAAVVGHQRRRGRRRHSHRPTPDRSAHSPALPETKKRAAPNDPSAKPSITAILSELRLVTTRSTRPSPLRSRAAMAIGSCADGDRLHIREEARPGAAHDASTRVRDLVHNRQIELAIAVEVPTATAALPAPAR